MNLMNTDNFVVRALNKMTDILVLNILFVLCSLPIFTIGASLSAMYTVNLRSIRYGDGYVVRTFFTAFKRNFKQSTAAWLIVLGIGFLLFVDLHFWGVMKDVMPAYSTIFTVLSYGIGILLWMVALWLFPVIAKMEDKLLTQIKNSAKMAFGFFFPYTFFCMLIQGGAVFLATRNTGMMMIMLVLGFAGVSYMCTFFHYKVFSRLITEEPASDDDPLYS